ncbi:hypothetical protein VNI00_010319 [Paramarasmius palmivorus]|uniref:Uncharacterized protein n=1 Tax=Paramarasmius palmivorus TaxID=297713 RepID=A0AAW0CLD4_9AGAR
MSSPGPTYSVQLQQALDQGLAPLDKMNHLVTGSSIKNCWESQFMLTLKEVNSTLSGLKGMFITPEHDVFWNVLVHVYGNKEVVDLDPSLIISSHERPNPSKEKGFLVIVRGLEQHIGKLGCQVHYFFSGTKSNENCWFVLGVVEFHDDLEILTEEQLDILPDYLEFVEESQERYKASHAAFKKAQKKARKKRPGVCQLTQPWYVLL